jgi:hypothetical protein
MLEVHGDSDECLEWPYGVDGGGYGLVRVGPRKVKVHRLALQMATGQDGEGLHAAHKPVVCHNRVCFNPKHLEWETAKENARDKALDGTKMEGECHWKSKLSEQQVRLIVALYDSGKFSLAELGRVFGVSYQQISSIGKRESWKHLWV